MTEKPLIIVDRFPSEKDWTLSEFYVDGIRRGVGVEDAERSIKVKGETRIPNGIYEIGFTYSPAFSNAFFMDDKGYLSARKDNRFNRPHYVLLVKDVPGFDGIRWHWGNTDLDSLGCYIVGSSFATFDNRKGVASSKTKYLEIYPVIYQHYLYRKAKGIKTYVEYRDKK